MGQLSHNYWAHTPQDATKTQHSQINMFKKKKMGPERGKQNWPTHSGEDSRSYPEDSRSYSSVSSCSMQTQGLSSDFNQTNVKSWKENSQFIWIN